MSTEPTPQAELTPADASPARRAKLVGAVLGAVALGGVALLLVALYAIAYMRAGGGVPRGTTVLGVDIGGLSTAAAQQKLDAELPHLAASAVTLRAGSQRFPIVPADAGLDVDAHETVARAGERSLNPFRLIPALFGVRHPVQPALAVDEAKLGHTVGSIVAQVQRPLREASVAFKNGKVLIVQPVEARAIDPRAVARGLRTAFLSGDTDVGVTVTTIKPKVPAAEVARAVREFATPAMSGPVTLRVASQSVRVPPVTIGRHLTMQAESRKLRPVLDGAGLLTALSPQLDRIAGEPKDASFRFVGGRPTVVPSKDGYTVDAAQLHDAVLAALPKTAPADRVAVVTAKPSHPKLTTADAQALGVKERISSFTTHYPVLPYRVNNIGRAAALINGSLILPGHTWSLNATIGERTVANGFVEGYIINEGKFAKELGGGTSQVATTTFNAIFFAGLRDIEHHPHSLYISRYPAGREATVAWGAKDLRFYNDSGHGVLIQTAHSPGAVTVTFWGTKKYDAVRSVNSARYNFRAAKTVQSNDPKCEPQAPVPGFDIDVKRVFVNGGQEVRRETFHTSYQATDKIVCGSP